MAQPVKMLKLKPEGFQFIQEIAIDAPPKKVWRSILDIGRWFQFSPTSASRSKLEPWAGGRFYSESPNGETALYAYVTLFEPNKLLRLGGPMGLSHLPAQNVFIFELQPKGKGTKLRLCQRTYGYLTKDVKKGYAGGWKQLLAQLKKLAEK